MGLPDYGGLRRVPGLRREELAQLAGVSVGYYTRLEQGQSPRVSDAVLDSVARVLRLDEAEHLHLRELARPRPSVPRDGSAERLRPGVRLLVGAFGDTPALVIGRHYDVLMWNPAAHALLAGHLPFNAPDRPERRPNIARLVFLDDPTRELYADWPAKADDTVAHLRRAATRYPDDPALAGLIDELALKSPEFARLWASHSVHPCVPQSTREFHHPVVGVMDLYGEILEPSRSDGQRVVVFTAEPGSGSEAALRRLARRAG